MNAMSQLMMFRLRPKPRLASSDAPSFARPALRTLLAGVACATLCAGAGAETQRDPTLPPAVWLALQTNGVQSAEKSTGVQMTLIGKMRRVALVDGQQRKTGDKLAGSTVTSIKRERVELEDTTKSLPVFPGLIKQKPSTTRRIKHSVVLESGDVAAKANGGNQ